jgi:hypothetical protein
MGGDLIFPVPAIVSAMHTTTFMALRIQFRLDGFNLCFFSSLIDLCGRLRELLI